MPALIPEPERYPADALTAPLADALHDRGPRTAVIVAEPGAGKTTRLPLALLDLPWCRRLVLTAPRRVAVAAAAERLAETLGERVGQTVGIRMRDRTEVSASTRIEVVTEGVLLRVLQQDPALEHIDAVVLDEVHERSLDVDLALTLTVAARDLLRPGLRIVAMSATLDDDRTAALLGHDGARAPVLRAAGRTHPIEVVHAPPAPGALIDDAARLALDAVDSGDVLVFLPGASEIRRTARALDRLGAGARARVLPLHGSGSPSEQRAALAPSTDRPRIVLATSIAQTSLTIPGVRTVIDTGLVRTSSFDRRHTMSRLVTVPVSRSTADQRAGRAGREAPGRCIRLWSSSDHRGRPPHDPPEIADADLTGLALALAVWGCNDPSDLRWLDAPADEAWRAAVATLQVLDAIDTDGRITEHGRVLASVPLEPRLAHLLVLARPHGAAVLRRAAALAALLSQPELGRGAEASTRSFTDAVEQLGSEDGPDDPRARRAVDALIAAVGGIASASTSEGTSAPSVAGLLSLVQPERIAGRDGNDPGRYRLAGGGIASLGQDAPERGASLLVVADLDGDRRAGRIWSALPIDADEVLSLHRDAALHVRRVWLDGDPLTGSVRATEETRIGAAVISSRSADPTPTEVAGTVAEAIDSTIIDSLLSDAAIAVLCSRVEVVRRHRPDWPAMDPASLLADLGEWLLPVLVTCSRRAPLRSVDVRAALTDRIGRHRLHELDRLAPASLLLPSGSTTPIDWTNPAGPTVSARVQQVFGLRESPSVVDGALRLRFELTSPAGRPAAVTDDLGRFWISGYPLVRAELRGRYPKHPWPEDPSTASPTDRVKPRSPR